MKKVQIEFDELPFSTLERFGLTTVSYTHLTLPTKA